MGNIKSMYMPVGQAVRRNYKSMKVWKFIKNNKIKLSIGAVVMALLTSYAFLITSFINLIKILN